MTSRRDLLKALMALPLPMLSAVPESSAASSDAWEDTVAAARREGKLNFYGVLGDLSGKFAKGFQSEFGIPVDLIMMRPGEMRSRVSTEKAAGRVIADVLYNGQATGTLLQQETGALLPYGDLPLASKIQPPFPVDGVLLPFGASSSGILINTNIVSSADAPTSWFDLLDPKWRGKILMDDPHADGGGFAMFNVLYNAFGREFHERLAAQKPVFTREAAPSHRRVALGEFPIYIPMSTQYATSLKDLPVKILLPKEGGPYTIAIMAALKGSPHPNCARLFMNYILDQGGQRSVAENGMVSSMPGVDRLAPDDLKPFVSAKLLGRTDAAQMTEYFKIVNEIYR